MTSQAGPGDQLDGPGGAGLRGAAGDPAGARGAGAGAGVPRWVRALGFAALAALVVVGGWQAGQAKPSPSPAPTPTPPLLIRPPVDFVQLPPAGATGLRLLVDGTRIVEVDPGTGRERPVTGVAADPGGYQLDDVGGGAVVLRAVPVCPHCPTDGYLLPAGSVAAIRLVGFDGAVPAAEPGRLWAYRNSSTPMPGAPPVPGRVQLIDLAGHPHGPAYPMPSGRTVVRGTVSGLISRQCCDVGYELWNPRTGRVSRTFGIILGATGTRVLWTNPSCSLDCPLWLTELAPGRPDVALPVHSDGLAQLVVQRYEPGLRGAAFTADGDLAAVVVTRRPAADSTGPTEEFFLLDLRAGAPRLVRIRAAAIAADSMPAMSWIGSRLVLVLNPLGPFEGQAVLSVATATVADPVLRRVVAPVLRGSAVVPR